MVKSDLSDPIASAVLVLVRPNGERVAVTVKVGRPYVVGELEARCPVAIEGLEPQYSDISGNDTLQALSLAMRFLRLRLDDQLAKGSRLIHLGDDGDDDDDDVDIGALFGER